MQANLFPITLIETYMLSPNVKHFIFQAEQTPIFDFLPGQFITMHFEREGKMLKRSYSIANAPLKDNRIEFAAGYVAHGLGTELLFHLDLGEQISINGPFGRLILKDPPPKRYILVATSTGITPYRSMLPSLERKLANDPAFKIVILLGVQTAIDAIYQDEFIQLYQRFKDQVTFRIQLSRADPSKLEDYQYPGYVQHAFEELALNPLEDIVYLCGNPSMIDEAFEDLKTKGFVMQNIIREKYISAR